MGWRDNSTLSKILVVPFLREGHKNDSWTLIFSLESLSFNTRRNERNLVFLRSICFFSMDRGRAPFLLTVEGNQMLRVKESFPSRNRRSQPVLMQILVTSNVRGRYRHGTRLSFLRTRVRKNIFSRFSTADPHSRGKRRWSGD